MTDQLAGTATQVSLPAKFADPLRVPPVLRPDGDHLTVHMRAADVRVHSELPPTPMWCYNGVFPGPTIEVRRGRKLRVEWRNNIAGPYPAAAVEVPLRQSPGTTPGRDDTGVAPIEGVDELPPWTVVHLHGAVTDGGHDGWTENAVLPGHSQSVRYHNDQRATALWYHDHAMDVTQYNVFAGLAGMYLVRDEEEAALKLPRGEHEVPLVLTDRNFDTDADGRFTGRMLKKIAYVPNGDTPVAQAVRIPFSGPFNLVNGVLWPYHDVAPRWYRFRVLNASNARIYSLALVGDDGPVPEGVAYQIGTDSGLLGAPIPVTGPIGLSPAERLDILVDFRAYAGKTLRLVDQANPAVEFADIMQFRVGTRQVDDRFTLPARLSPTFQRLTPADVPAEHRERFVAFVPPAPGKMPEMWELAEEAMPVGAHASADGVIELQPPGEPEPRTLHRVARMFEDTVNFFADADADGWEVWHVLNLGQAQNRDPAHPFHIHLIGFQVLARDVYDVTGFDAGAGGTTRPVTYQRPGEVPPAEQGWKDVVLVSPGELVTWAGRFTGGTGRFMYHCHLLEHADEGMMRPFVTVPPEVLRLDMMMGPTAVRIRGIH